MKVGRGVVSAPSRTSGPGIGTPPLGGHRATRAILGSVAERPWEFEFPLSHPCDRRASFAQPRTRRSSALSPIRSIRVARSEASANHPLVRHDEDLARPGAHEQLGPLRTTDRATPRPRFGLGTFALFWVPPLSACAQRRRGRPRTTGAPAESDMPNPGRSLERREPTWSKATMKRSKFSYSTIGVSDSPRPHGKGGNARVTR